MDHFEVSIKSENLEEPKTIDDYFGYDIKQTLEEIEYNMEGLSMTIVMEPHDKESSNELKQIFEYKLDDEEESVKVKTEQIDEDEEQQIEVLIKQEREEVYPEEDQWLPDEDLIKLVERIELRQKAYYNLFNKVMGKLKELQEQYSEEDYKFSIIKRNKRHPNSQTASDNSSDSDSDCSSSCEEDSIERSSDCSYKRKSSSEDSDSEIEHKLKNQCTIQYPFVLGTDSDVVVIGPSGTQINRKEFESLQWKDAAGATRELCNVIFGERTLATHSLTGNQSPAFRGRERPIKAQLDLAKTSDITHFICAKFNVTQQLVRATITTKCADAAKKIKRIKLRKNSIKL